MARSLTAVGVSAGAIGGLLWAGFDLLGWKGPLLGSLLIGLAILAAGVAFVSSKSQKRVSKRRRIVTGGVALALAVAASAGAYRYRYVEPRKLFSDTRSLEVIWGPTEPSVESIDLDGAGVLIAVPPYDVLQVGLGIKVGMTVMRADPKERILSGLVQTTDNRTFDLNKRDHIFNVGLRSFHVLLEEISEIARGSDTEHKRIKYTFRINEL